MVNTFYYMTFVHRMQLLVSWLQSASGMLIRQRLRYHFLEFPISLSRSQVSVLNWCRGSYCTHPEPCVSFQVRKSCGYASVFFSRTDEAMIRATLVEYKRYWNFDSWASVPTVFANYSGLRQSRFQKVFPPTHVGQYVIIYPHSELMPHGVSWSNKRASISTGTCDSLAMILHVFSMPIPKHAQP